MYRPVLNIWNTSTTFQCLTIVWWWLYSVCIKTAYLFFLLQGFASDTVRYFAFFSYFTIQLAQLFLCCFADQPPVGKTILEKVVAAQPIENAHTAILWVFKCCHQDIFSHSEKILWVQWRPLHPLPQSRHFFFGLPVRGVWMCTFSCIPSDYALTSDRQWPHKQDFIAISHPIKRSKGWLNASQQVNEFVINETDRWCHVVSQGDNVQNNWKSPEQASGRRQGCWGCRSRSLVVQTHPWVAFWRASSSSSSANSFPPHSGQSYSQEERGCGGDEGRE